MDRKGRTINDTMEYKLLLRNLLYIILGEIICYCLFVYTIIVSVVGMSIIALHIDEMYYIHTEVFILYTCWVYQWYKYFKWDKNIFKIVVGAGIVFLICISLKWPIIYYDMPQIFRIPKDSIFWVPDINIVFTLLAYMLPGSLVLYYCILCPFAKRIKINREGDTII